jgi:exonuclease SbcD
MTKLINFSDFHAHLFNDYAKPDPEFENDRFRAQIETLQKVFSMAREHKAVINFAGDLFHKRSKIDDIVFNTVYRVFAENADVPVLMTRGNHDARTNATVTPHWLETFQYLPNVTVFAVPEKKYISAGGRSFFHYAIPYSDDIAFLKQQIVEFAEHAKKQTIPTILTAHIGVDGSEVGKYSHRLEGAFKLGDLFPDVFDYVVLGHYHKRQFLGGLDNAFYVGNTIQNSFSDEGQEKGVMLFDAYKKEKPEFIPIKNKQFITLTEITADTQDIIDNNYVRFILPKEQAQEVEIFKESTDNIRVEIQREYNVETRINIDRESTEEQIVEAYAKERYPEALEVALDIIREAKLATSN